MAEFKNNKPKKSLGSRIHGFGGLFKGFKQVKPSDAMTATQDAFYEEAYNYIQKELPSKLSKVSAETSESINIGQNFALSSNRAERAYHDTMLKAVNLRGLHDLTLSSPDMDESLLRSIRVKENGIEYGMSDLVMIMQRSPAGNAKSTTANPVSPSTISYGGYKLARLQVIPLTDNIYMSLAKNGGFYVREDKYLVPLRLEDVEDYIKTLKKFNSPAYIKDSVKNIHNFNRFVYETTAKLKSSAESPDDVLRSISISTTTPTTSITYGSPGAEITQSNNFTTSSPSITPSNDSGSTAIPLGNSSLSASSNTFTQSNEKPFIDDHPANQLARLAGLERGIALPFAGVSHDSQAWSNMYKAVKDKLPTDRQWAYHPNTFDTDLLIASLNTGQSPKAILTTGFIGNSEMLESIANLPLSTKKDYILKTARNYLSGRGIPAGDTITSVYNAFMNNPKVFASWKESIAEGVPSLAPYTPERLDF